MMTTQIPLTDCSEFSDYANSPRKAGRDPMLTQGSTGNSSLKRGDGWWIKSSGPWMGTGLGSRRAFPQGVS